MRKTLQYMICFTIILLTAVISTSVVMPLAHAEGDCQGGGCSKGEDKQCPAGGGHHWQKGDWKKFDANGDGKLDDAEKAAMKKAHEDQQAAKQ